MRGAPGGTISGRRPLPECPSDNAAHYPARWHKLPLAFAIKIVRHLTASRGPDASAETCEKVLRTFSVCSGASQTAIETRIRRCRADEQQKINRTFAHIYRFRDFVPLEPCDQKSVRAVPIQYGCRPDDFRFHRSGGMLFLNLSMCATLRLIFQLHVRAITPYARFDRCLRGSRANRKSSENFFACFGWTNIVRAKPWGVYRF